MTAASLGLPAWTYRQKVAWVGIQGLISFLRLLGPIRASNFGGAVAAALGPWIKSSRVADRNLAVALPALDATSRQRIVREVWRNLGRNVGELPHLPALLRSAEGPGWELAGAQNMPPGQAIFFSAHCHNWEMILPIASQLGMAVSGAYRRASDPVAEAAIQGLRMAALEAHVSMFPKGAAGARAALAHVAGGGSLGLLADQKMNDGVAAPFFGRMAMTATAPAQFALRFGLPLVPIRIKRLGPARLQVVFEPALRIEKTGNRQADILAVTSSVNQVVEGWVRDDPACWLWLHRRWPKEHQV